MSKNVMLAVLALSGDKHSMRAGAALEFSRSAVYGWLDGDVSIMLATAAECRKTRIGKALADTLGVFADVIRAQRTGGRVRQGEGEASAWRVACYLPTLPDFAGTEGKAQRGPLGLASDGKQDGWAVAVSRVWLDAVDKHIALAKEVAENARRDKKDKAATEAAASAVVLAAAKALETEKDTAEISAAADARSAQDDELIRLRAVVAALTTENSRLAALLAAADFAQGLAVADAVAIALAEAQQQGDNAQPAFISTAKIVKAAQKTRKTAAA